MAEQESRNRGIIMSDMNPKGELLVIGGEKRHLLLNINTIAEIQDHYDMTLDEAVGMLTDKREAVKALRTVVTILLNDEADRKKREGCELKHYTEQEVGWLITQENVSEVLLTVLRAYGLSLPEPDEFESPNVTSGQTG